MQHYYRRRHQTQPALEAPSLCRRCAAPSAAVGLLQMTAQDVGTMMRFGAAPIIFLVNNAGYAIEIEIHDGPYNQ